MNQIGMPNRKEKNTIGPRQLTIPTSSDHQPNVFGSELVERFKRIEAPVDRVKSAMPKMKPNSLLSLTKFISLTMANS